MEALTVTHIVRSDIALKPLNGTDPLVIHELPGGDLVAVHFAATRTPINTLDCYIAAWLVDADGDAQASIDQPVLVAFRHNAPMHEVTALGAQGIATAMLDLVMGEVADPPVIPWGDAVRSELNINNAITMARAAGQIIDFGSN